MTDLGFLEIVYPLYDYRGIEGSLCRLITCHIFKYVSFRFWHTWYWSSPLRAVIGCDVINLIDRIKTSLHRRHNKFMDRILTLAFKFLVVFQIVLGNTQGGQELWLPHLLIWQLLVLFWHKSFLFYPGRWWMSVRIRPLFETRLRDPVGWRTDWSKQSDVILYSTLRPDGNWWRHYGDWFPWLLWRY